MLTEKKVEKLVAEGVASDVDSDCMTTTSCMFEHD